MIQQIQKRPYGQRVVIFAALVAAVIIIIFLITLGVAYVGVNAAPRNQSIAIQDSVTVREWVALPDDDSYPAALTIDAAGNVYTGSYVSGAVWRISPEGDITELPQTRETFGAVTGLVWADDALYVLDRRHPLSATGLTLWRWRDQAAPEKLFDEAATNRIPYDLARDAEGNLYVSSVVIGRESEIVRYPLTGEAEVWWTGTANAIITGLAYNAATQEILASATNESDIYAIPIANPAESYLFYHNQVDPAPQFDGLTVAADGTVYIAALGLNRVAQITPQGELSYLAGAFRGSSRVAYDAERKRLYVNNWDQRSLLADQVLFVQVDVTPKLPFALDVVEWK